MPIAGTLRIALRPLNSGLGPALDRLVDQVGPDAQRVGIVDRWNQGHEVGATVRELGRFGASQIANLDRRDADARNLGAVRQLALGEDRHDLVVVLDPRDIHAAQIARRDDLLEHPVFAVEQVERAGLGDCALDHIIRGKRRVLNLDAGIGLAFLGQLAKRVHPGAGIADRDRVGGVNRGEAVDQAATQGETGSCRGALEYLASRDSLFRLVARCLDGHRRPPLQ